MGNIHYNYSTRKPKDISTHQIFHNLYVSNREGVKMNDYVDAIRSAVINFKLSEIEHLIQEAVDNNTNRDAIVSDGLIRAMDLIGDRFEQGEIFVPEMLSAALTMKKGLEVLKLHLTEGRTQSRGKVIIGTVQGDLHDLGKSLVAMMLEGGGFEVFDLGVDVSPDTFVEQVKALQPDIIGLSALLTTTMHELKHVIDALVESGIRGKVQILIGGAPVTSNYAQEIGADAYGDNAAKAVRLARELMTTGK